MVSSNIVVAAISAALATALTVPNYQVEPGDYHATDSVGIALQNPDYPAGCEPISLTLLLNSYSYDIGMPDIMEYFDITTNDFVNGFWGSIYSEGAAYPGAVVTAANRYLEEQNSKLRARAISGYSWDVIKELVTDGKPLMMWCTTDYQPPIFMDWHIGNMYMYVNEHCVVVYGVENDVVYISDPLRGHIEVPEKDFSELWKLCGSMAVMLEIKE